ncbi:MAG: DnaJ domain-containing protein [Patescibacteria group bacterium]|nr:DnaJ domain-containing protein [Patescibacteria group bacterium]
MKDYYKILGVQRSASVDDIKKAYRILAHKHHPDKGGNEKAFKEINEAYQILSDQEKRAQYDKFRRVFDGGGVGPGAGGFQWGWGGEGVASDESGFHFDFQDLGDVFEDIFGGHQHNHKDKRRGGDLEVEVEIPLQAVLNNHEELISLLKLTVCSRCNGVGAEPGTNVNECFACRGSGEVQQIKRTVFGSFTRVGTCPECSGEGLKPEKPCNVCKGDGCIKTENDIKIIIPAGVDTNQILKIEGKGDAGKKTGKPGDLYIRIFVKPHKDFTRKGDDLHHTLTIPYSKAILGGKINLCGIDGETSVIQIPSGMVSGTIIKVGAKGIPHFGGLGRGDLQVRLEVHVPKTLTKQQKEVLNRLQEEGL